MIHLREKYVQELKAELDVINTYIKRYTSKHYVETEERLHLSEITRRKGDILEILNAM